MSVTRRVIRVALPAAVSMLMLASLPGTAQATIHPIIQSVSCAAAAASANAPIGDPPGQTPEGFVGDSISVAFPFLTISFPEPLEFSQSDFRALIATGFVDEIVLNTDGNVTALIVDLRSLPNAGSGQGGAHCSNA